MVMIGSFYVRLPFSYKKTQKGTENWDRKNDKIDYFPRKNIFMKKKRPFDFDI